MDGGDMLNFVARAAFVSTQFPAKSLRQTDDTPRSEAEVHLEGCKKLNTWRLACPSNSGHRP
jgi:hypothetical protein